MQAPIAHKIFDQTFWLSAHRCLFWEEEKALILSDLHLGKTGHFRKAGIAVPPSVLKEDLQRLVDLFHYFKPTQVIAVGDLFHSKENLELELFKRWRSNFEGLTFKLVKGNHDILKKEWYQSAAIEVIDHTLTIGRFSFTHDQCDAAADTFSFCGHLHPGVVLNGLGKQSLRFPCFYFAPDHCILPAFGKFTGLATVHPTKNDSVYAIVENALIPLKK
ncbi:MAG: ligase-associated DNA damage response endonuclease PdeM [Chitinophagaceae bacterium]